MLQQTKYRMPTFNWDRIGQFTGNLTDRKIAKYAREGRYGDHYQKLYTKPKSKPRKKPKQPKSSHLDKLIKELL